MFKNYIKTALRGLKKNKGFTFINVFGLALGLAICLLIVFYVVDELGYDHYNEKADRIYRINTEIKFGGRADVYAVSPPPLGPTLAADFPEVEQAVRFRQTGGFDIKKGDQTIHEDKVTYVDPSIFDIFTLPMISGNPKTALRDPNNIVITESIAKKYFNRTNVAGETLVMNGNKNYKIGGVIKDMPQQSHFIFDLFMPMSGLKEGKDDTWLSNNFQTYVLLKPGADIKTLVSKLPALISAKVTPQLQGAIHISFSDFEKAGNYFKMSAIPLKDIHLHSNTVGEMGQNGDIIYVYIFSAIAVFILLIACVNFMNLSTARSSNRAKEVGVRKVLGSARKNLIFQFLTESILLTLGATIIAVVGAWALLPLFNQMSGKELSISLHAISWLIPVLLLIIVVVGCLAGSYPAFFLSGFQPISVLKGKLSTGFKGGRLRSSLVVFQFFISVFLIIGTLVIYNQLKFIRNKDLGYDRSHVLIIKNTYALNKSAGLLKQQVKELPGVQSVTLSSYTPTGGSRNSTTMFRTTTPNVKDGLQSQVWSVDEDYLNVMSMKLVKGRNFSKDMPTDSSTMIVNETFAKQFGEGDPVNKMVYMPMDSKASVMKPFRIIGVIKDFNFSSLRENVSPVAFLMDKDNGSLSVKIKTANIPALLSAIENKWKTMSSGQQFSYTFMEQDFDGTYRTEQRLGSIFIAFTSLAIIIACLGLFGLAAYAAEQRTKEIGIRKVLGADVSNIVAMLSKDFIKLVLIAIVLAAPLAWFVMEKLWLQSFYYRQNVQWWVIAVAGGTAILIAFVTISFQSIKAALINPVKSLRSE